MKFVKAMIRALTPIGLVELRRAWLRRRAEKLAIEEQLSAREQFHEERRRRIRAVEEITSGAHIKSDDYEGLIGYLVDHGLPEHHVRDGSIPFESLQYINDRVFAPLAADAPTYVLHLGNFVGVSLAFIAGKVAAKNPESVVVTVDPNVPHRGIHNPQGYVMKLLQRCGLERSVIAIAGYSIEKNISNDGDVFEGYDPVQKFAQEAACEHILINLVPFFSKRFDVVCLDGNHDAKYLRREIQRIVPLVKDGGWIILDDVDWPWEEIRATFGAIAEFGLDAVATNGRVGIARLPKGG